MLYLLLRSLTDWLDEHGLYRIFGLLDEIEFRALLAAGLSFALVLAAGPATIRWLRRMKIGDAGVSDSAALSQHAAGKANTPTMGGILIVGAMVFSILLLADLSRFYVLAGLLVLVAYACLGAADDWLKLTAKRRGTGSRQGLYAWEKFVFQIGLAAVVAYFAAQQNGDLVRVLNLPFQRTYVPNPGMEAVVQPGLIILPTAAFVIIGALFIAGLSNAANITDGMDGLAGGVSAVVAAGLFVLAWVAGSDMAVRLLVPRIEGAGELAVMAGAMGGACLGFLWWNCSPASVFMGDTGSLALGALIGYIALIIRQEAVVALFCLVFILEILSVMIQVAYFRATGGKRVFKCAPYHHHLHLSHWTEQQIVARFWIISIVCLILGLASVKIR